MTTDYERAQNKKIDWKTREIAPPDGAPEGTQPTFEVYDPEAGTVVVSVETQQLAGIAVSDLKTYGNLNHPLIFGTQEGTSHGQSNEETPGSANDGTEPTGSGGLSSADTATGPSVSSSDNTHNS